MGTVGRHPPPPPPHTHIKHRTIPECLFTYVSCRSKAAAGVEMAWGRVGGGGRMTTQKNTMPMGPRPQPPLTPAPGTQSWLHSTWVLRTMDASSSPASNSRTEKPAAATRAAITHPELPAPTTMSAVQDMHKGHECGRWSAAGCKRWGLGKHYRANVGAGE
jgi:hypothetical protein